MRQLFKEAYQFAVHLIGVCPEHPVRTARQLDELNVLDHFRLPPRCGFWRQNAIRVPVQNEHWHIVACNVLAEIFEPGVNTQYCPDRGGVVYAATFEQSNGKLATNKIGVFDVGPPPKKAN